MRLNYKMQNLVGCQIEVTPPMPVPSPDVKGGGFEFDISLLDSHLACNANHTVA